jgi:hypothetical protein
MIKSPKFSWYTPLIAVAAMAVACTGAGAQEAGSNDVEGDAAAVTQTPSADVAQTPSTEVSCEMAFTMKGWSAIISKAEGEGVVTCDNGQTEPVTLEITGGGLTFGKTTIDDGKGVFSDVADISEVFGAYAQAEASAGAVDAVSAQAMTKGEVSLAITTKGSGWSLGVSGAKFTIARPVVSDVPGDGS